MDNKKFSEDLLPLIGGADNVTNVITCHTRLRISLEDYDLVNDAKVKELSGVMATRMSADQYQIIIGDTVKETYNEFIKYVHIQEPTASEKVSATTTKKKFDPIGTFAETMSAVFTPLIITICGSGLMTGLQVLLVTLGVITTESTFYTILTVLGNVAFYYLPFTIAVSAADRFKCNKFMAMMMAGILMHPTWETLAAGGLDNIYLFGFVPIRLLSYSSAVIPPLLAVYALSKLEKLLTKVIPAALGTVLIPCLELLILGPIILAFIGPFSQWASDLLANGYLHLYNVASIPASILFAAFYPLIVLTGCHLTFLPLMLESINTSGVDYIMPLMSVAHCGLAGASLAVMLKTTNGKFKSVATSSTLITAIGLTEPALYGVCLPLKKPLIISCICSGVGGLIYGIFHVSALALGLSPLGSIPLYFTDTFIYWVIGGVVTAGLSFAGTWFFGYKDGDEKKIPQYAEGE